MPRLRTLVLAGLLCALGSVALATRAHAQATPDLKSLTLTAEELGPQWTRIEEDSSEQDGYIVLYARGQSALGIVLIDDPGRRGTPADAVRGALTGLRSALEGGMLSTTDLPPPALGESAARLGFTIMDRGQVVSGDLIAWRRDRIIATIFHLAARNADALPFAQQQDAKLVAGLGGAPVAETATPAPAGAEAAVAFVSVTSVRPGAEVSVTVQAPVGARCTIEYRDPSGTLQTAIGLEAKTADASGRVTWSWQIPLASRRGSGSVRVSCDGVSVTAPIQVL